ncbi:MAG TPA: hypothetical protein VMU69_22765 [Bradyrhizobium sp.]|nr:hypothetical protein [Bradyrhizobium sp.]
MTNDARQAVASFYAEHGKVVELVLLRRGHDPVDAIAHHGIDAVLAAIVAKIDFEDSRSCQCANPSCGLEMMPEDEPEALLVVIGRKTMARITLATCQKCAELMTDREITAHLLELWPAGTVPHAVACA